MNHAVAVFACAAFACLGLTALPVAASPAADAPAAGPAPVAADGAPVPRPPLSERVRGREEARVAFANSVRTFRVEREDGTDVLYLQDNRRNWLRGELSCFGIGDPRDAFGLRTLDHSPGIDRFSRLRLVGFSRHDGADCRLRSLVRLTAEEALEAGLVRPARPAAPAAAPSAS